MDNEARPLRRVLYTSRACKPDPAQTDDAFVERILAGSRRRNAERGLTGALIFGHGRFGQVLEGSAAALDSLFARLMADPRHAGVRVLEESAPETRAFSAWTMAYVEDLDIIPAAFARQNDSLAVLMRLRAAIRAEALAEAGLAAGAG